MATVSLETAQQSKKMFTSDKYWLMSCSSPPLSQMDILHLMFPTQSTEVHKYQGIPWDTRSPRKEKYHVGRAEGSGFPWRFNASFRISGPKYLPPLQGRGLHLLSIKVILIFSPKSYFCYLIDATMAQF